MLSEKKIQSYEWLLKMSRRRQEILNIKRREKAHCFSCLNPLWNSLTNNQYCLELNNFKLEAISKVFLCFFSIFSPRLSLTKKEKLRKLLKSVLRSPSFHFASILNLSFPYFELKSLANVFILNVICAHSTQNDADRDIFYEFNLYITDSSYLWFSFKKIWFEAINQIACRLALGTDNDKGHMITRNIHSSLVFVL